MRVLEIEKNEEYALKWLLINGMERTKSDKKYEIFEKWLGVAQKD